MSNVSIFMTDSQAVDVCVAVRIAVAVTGTGDRVSGHAGKARHWLAYVCVPGQPVPRAQRITLAPGQLLHVARDGDPHPLQGFDVVVAGSAGEGFIRHMATWGAQVLLTGEPDPDVALARILDGQALPDTRFDVTTTLCKLRDLFSRH